MRIIRGPRNKIHAVTEKGIWETSDKGKSWAKLDLEKHLKKYENKTVDKFDLHQTILLDIYNDLDR